VENELYHGHYLVRGRVGAKLDRTLAMRPLNPALTGSANWLGARTKVDEHSLS